MHGWDDIGKGDIMGLKQGGHHYGGRRMGEATAILFAKEKAKVILVRMLNAARVRR